MEKGRRGGLRKVVKEGRRVGEGCRRRGGWGQGARAQAPAWEGQPGMRDSRRAEPLPQVAVQEDQGPQACPLHGSLKTQDGWLMNP